MHKNLLKKGRKICLWLFAPDGCTMSRRKQAKPQHINSDEPGSLENGKFTHRRAIETPPHGPRRASHVSKRWHFTRERGQKKKKVWSPDFNIFVPALWPVAFTCDFQPSEVWKRRVCLIMLNTTQVLHRGRPARKCFISGLGKNMYIVIQRQMNHFFPESRLTLKLVNLVNFYILWRRACFCLLFILYFQTQRFKMDTICCHVTDELFGPNPNLSIHWNISA